MIALVAAAVLLVLPARGHAEVLEGYSRRLEGRHVLEPFTIGRFWLEGVDFHADHYASRRPPYITVVGTRSGETFTAEKLLVDAGDHRRSWRDPPEMGLRYLMEPDALQAAAVPPGIRVTWLPSPTPSVDAYWVYAKPTGAGAEIARDVGDPKVGVDGRKVALVDVAAGSYVVTMTARHPAGESDRTEQAIPVTVVAQATTSTVPVATTTTLPVSAWSARDDFESSILGPDWTQATWETGTIGVSDGVARQAVGTGGALAYQVGSGAEGYAVGEVDSVASNVGVCLGLGPAKMGLCVYAFTNGWEVYDHASGARVQGPQLTAPWVAIECRGNIARAYTGTGSVWTERYTAARACGGYFGIGFYTPTLPSGSLKAWQAGAGPVPPSMVTTTTTATTTTQPPVTTSTVTVTTTTMRRIQLAPGEKIEVWAP